MIGNSNNTMPSSGLSPAEATLVSSFREMDDGAAADMLLAMAALAKQFPRQRPALRLVVGGSV